MTPSTSPTQTWRLNTTPKRIFFLVMTVGFLILVVSLATYFSSPYHSILKIRYFYGWTTGNAQLDAYPRYTIGQNDIVYRVDSLCAEPFITLEIQKEKAALDAHQAQKPAYYEFSQLQQWTDQDVALEVQLEGSQSEAASIGDSVRRGEIQDSILHSRSQIDTLIPVAQARSSLNSVKPLDQKFNDALRSELGISVFPQLVSDEIFDKCVQKIPVQYQLWSTEWNSDLGLWFQEEQLYSYTAIILIFVGFFGSFAQGVTVALWKISGGRVISWARNPN
jgi:hypothetical protein